ncbi:MAG: hypothetical protein PHU33_13615 [Bacteroidales bacterium]|nr:hypothetical protein [Bacteroidales bacterium]
MNKLLILCEGSNEKKIIEILLRHDKLKFTEDDLIGLVPYHARQLNAPVIVPALNMYHGVFDVFRIGDKQNDQLKITRQMKTRIGRVEKYCTKPELEVLLIINEGLYPQFIKSGKSKPKEFAKKYVVYQKRRYDNATEFYESYYGDRAEVLVNNLREYKRLKKHDSDELFLADLIKDQ